MTNEQKEQIREEFRIKHFDFAGGEPVGTDEIADFWLSKLDSLLTSQRESLVEKIDKLEKDYYGTTTIPDKEKYDTFIGYNKALEDVKEILNLITQSDEY